MNYRTLLFVLAYFLTIPLPRVIHANNITEGQRLHNFLFTDYEVSVRPAEDQSKPVQVKVDLALNTILDLNEVTQSLTISGCMSLVWKDPRLKWNKTEFGNIDTVYESFKAIWIPDLTLLNYYDKMIDFNFHFMKVTIESDGTVIWMPGDVFKVPCIVDVTYFPFDYQTCKMYFGCWSSSEKHVKLETVRNDLDLAVYKNNVQWSLVKTKAFQARAPLGYAIITQIIFEVTMARKPTFCFLNYVLPVIVLSLLSVFVYLLPAESGEKISYSITVLLAFAVYLSFISNIMPKTSDTTPLYAMYVTILVFLSAFIVLATVIILRVFGREDKVPIGNHYKQVVFVVRNLSKTFSLRKRQSSASDTPSFSNVQNTETVQYTCNDPPITWKEVSRALDTMGFILTFIALILTTVIINLRMAFHPTGI